MDANLELSKQNICSRVLAEMLLLNENISGSTTRLQQSIKLDYLGNVKVRNRTRRGLGETQLQELGNCYIHLFELRIYFETTGRYPGRSSPHLLLRLRGGSSGVLPAHLLLRLQGSSSGILTFETTRR
ncbi:PREDICTED: uncharacterized protein LOC109215616 isoform X1 [Nicotiana attenuata]|uniref:uncharacterized protein LOC109215616 isoform X1 n=1 Tax=Nicotiana attenuata TaxID=49451 RepID=UPI000904C01F|nr:PREDICTED: uncharacterized protein LOC109215616 isoform X1 [Nicotiana attenuata]